METSTSPVITVSGHPYGPIVNLGLFINHLRVMSEAKIPYLVMALVLVICMSWFFVWYSLHLDHER
jgi:hypothetical protein